MGEHKWIARNKKAFFNYEIIEKFEAGIVLVGCEVKSIRQGDVSIKESYAKIINGELFLLNCHINPYKQGNTFNPEPARDRKLLLHKREIEKLLGKIKEKGFTIVPLGIYFSNQRVKVALGLARSKKQFDKRRVLKDREIKREAERAVKRFI